MKTYTVTPENLEITRIAYGCMRIGHHGGGPGSEGARSHAHDALSAALDAGIRFFDHADIYGKGESEAVFGRLWPSLCRREEIVIQTKCGIRFGDDPEPGTPRRFDFSRQHICSSVEASLRRLQTGFIDILLLHRPDMLSDPAEVAEAFEALRTSGKVRYFGVSNQNPWQMELLRSYLSFPLFANQVELSVLHSGMLAEGVYVNQTQSVPSEGVLEYCQLRKILIQAWSPLARGRLTANNRESDDPAVRASVRLVEELAHQYGISEEAIQIAWLLRHPAGIQPILGTCSPARIRAACRGDEVVLTREDWYRLFLAGRGIDGLP